MKHYPTHRCRGIMVADALIGLFIVGSLLTVLAIASGYNQRARAAAAQQQFLLTEAELTLLALRSGGQPARLLDPATDVTIEREPAPFDQSDDWVWVRVEASKDGKSASLIGRVPISALWKEEADQP